MSRSGNHVLTTDRRFRRLSVIFACVVCLIITGIAILYATPEPDTLLLAGLFIGAFGAATLLPLQSEAFLISLLLTQTHSPLLLVMIASTGNIFGSCVNWFLGAQGERFTRHRFFPIKPEMFARVTHWYQRYGWWTLWFSWMPVIGDPLTVMAGLMRTPLRLFVCVVGLAKTLRYGLIAYLTLSWQDTF